MEVLTLKIKPAFPIIGRNPAQLPGPPDIGVSLRVSVLRASSCLCGETTQGVRNVPEIQTESTPIMSTAHESLERAEHAGHSAEHSGDHKGNGKVMGLTMALMGVLIALCAALVGAQRNELTRSMIEQTQANSLSTSASTKFRIIMIELEKQRGVMPHASHLAAAEPATGADSPEQVVLKRLLQLYLDYSQERALSSKWAEVYQPLVEAHFTAAESFEHGQLIAEIGIVLASLAVLLSSRPAWFASLGFGVFCIGLLILTGIHTRQKVEEATHQVKVQEEAYTDLRKAHTTANQDETTVEVLDPGGKMRAAMQEHH